MLYAVSGVFLLLLVYGPFIWVRYVLWRYAKPLDGMPGTGGELAEHLVAKYELQGVHVVKGAKGEDFYSPAEKKISLSPDYYSGKSLTAVAVAAHEVGHAIQFCREEPVSRLRDRFLGPAFKLKRVSGYFLMALPVVMFLSRSPAAMIGVAALAIAAMLLSVLMYVAILPEEYDASFNKALPILSNGYLPESAIPGVRSVLRACAMTYVAGALADVLSLWRWVRYLR